MAATKTTANRGYDIIGDIHGCANTLARLLDQMGYRKINGVYQHPRRQAIFIGDIIDRGPRIREALHLVRDMVEHGSARIVMGNHEYNALGYCTRARPGSGKTFLREHNARHDRLTPTSGMSFSSGSTPYRCSSTMRISALCTPVGMAT